MKTRLVPAGGDLGEETRLFASGELVAFPTETVYGLGADARRDGAVRKIFEAKGRPAGNPVIVHVGGVEEARGCAAEGAWNARAEALARRFWPGPLTVIVRRGEGISPLVSAGRETVGLRCPRHPVALALLKAFGGPIAAPSANRSGFTSPTTAAHVMAELAGRVPLILDGGTCAVGVESTVVDVSGTVPTVLRPGAVTAEMLREVIGHVEVRASMVREEDSAESPGQHSRHYAPRTAAYRFERADWARCGPSVRSFAGMMASAGRRLVLITHDPVIVIEPPHETILMPEDSADFARNMYASLRAADESGGSSILVLMPDSHEGIWEAVRDRLNRATEPIAVLWKGSQV